MSGTVQAGLIFGVAAVLAFVGGLLIPIGCLNFIIAFGSVLALGWGAGYTASKATEPGQGRGAGRGMVAGAIAGAVVLIVSLIAFVILANTAAFQAALSEALREASATMGDAVDPNVGGPGAVTVLGTSTGLAAGFCLGLMNLLLMVIGGAIGGAMWQGTPSIANTGQGAYGSTTIDPNEGARIYDSDDPHRRL